MQEGGISDELLLKRLAAIQTSAFVAGVAQGRQQARQAGNEAWATEIHARHTYRMHSLSEFIDLNPVRAGMVKDPADFRWSSYGEAIGGGSKGNGKKAREGLVRACLSHRCAGFEAGKWLDAAKIYPQMMGLALQRKSGEADLTTTEQEL